MKTDYHLTETGNENRISSIELACTRRQVLIWSGGTILGLSALKPVSLYGADLPVIIVEQAGGLVVADPVLCVGCGRCELACSEFNDGKASPSASRIKVSRNLHYGPGGTANRNAGQGNMGDGLIVQDLCKQCPHPVPCANICPENAIVLSSATRARMIDPDKCTGCKVCLQACPWDMISFDPESNKANKCHLCGGRPKCVEACPAGALLYVMWEDLTGKIPPRNWNTAPLPSERSLTCRECHLPGQSHNLRSIGTMIRQRLQGERPGPSGGIGFQWLDMAGSVIVLVAIGGVAVHAFLRKVIKR